MKVLTATTLTNGERDNDFDWCTQGELVMSGLIRDRDWRDLNNGCGCGRAFAGLHSHRSTTTALVEEQRLSPTDLAIAVRTSLEDGGWITESVPEDDARAMVDEAIGTIKQAAAYFPTGTVIGTRLGQVFDRKQTNVPF